MSEKIKRNCNTCKFGLFERCSTLKNNEQYQEIKDIWKFKENFICNNYNSIYIEYPIEVTKINKDDDIYSFWNDKIGKFVRVRPYNEEQTYLGLYIGDLPVGFKISYNSIIKELDVSFNISPAMFVFDLKKVIYGHESWWEFIESDKLKTIIDVDIKNVWGKLG